MKVDQVKEMLTELVTECASHTIKTLNELSNDRTIAGNSLRSVITPMLVSAWQKMPIDLGVPNQLESLSLYYDKPNLYAIHAGKIIDIMIMITKKDFKYKNLN